MSKFSDFSSPLGNLGAGDVLANLTDGVYITDCDRKILYWSDAAERITGWTREEVVGRGCRDNILCHVDKEGRLLCGKEHCPLHRTIVTGKATKVPIIVFAKSRTGARIPMTVNTCPLKDRDGEIIGAIEVFRDMTHVMDEMQRAKTIQASALTLKVAPDPRIQFRTLYSPKDMVGGDFYSIEDLDEHRVVMFIADVMGHGVSAALYSMFFRMLWVEHRQLLGTPARFLEVLDQKIHPLVRENFYFATAAMAVLDKETGALVCAGAGHPSPMIFRGDGTVEKINCAALPLGLIGEGGYTESRASLNPGDSFFLYTDGAVEIGASDGEQLGEEGLERVVRETLSPGRPLSLKRLEENILRYSNEIRPEDDVTMIWAAYRMGSGEGPHLVVEKHDDLQPDQLTTK